MKKKGQVGLAHKECELGGGPPWVHIPAVRSCVTSTKILSLSGAVLASVRIEGCTHIAGLR